MVENGTPAQRMLVSFAHPDDETFGLGGLILRYVKAGVDAQLICATNGEEGDIAPAYFNGFETKAEVRLAELACAAEKLGFSQTYTFGYRDSGMMGAESNNHSLALWQIDQTVLTAQVAEVIRRVRPQVVITFDPFGGYGHPDHIAIHRATLAAFHAAADPDYAPEQIEAGLAPFQAQRLYYPVYPRAAIRAGVWLARLRGQDPRHMGRNNDMDFVAVLEATIPTHLRLDLRPYYDEWQDAMACHASQVSGSTGGMRLPRFLMRQFFGFQSIYQAWPEVNGSHSLKHDLFEGLDD